MPSTETVKGRRLIAEALRDAGIETVFTVAGGHFLPTYHELGQVGGPFIVTARHEQGAGYMASGYALATGRPGVVFSGAPGPGATNLTTAVANAHADSIPLLVVSAQVDSRYIHRNILQYCDNVALFAPFTKSSVQAVSVEEVPNLIATGLQVALSGRPAPVHVAIPQDVQAADAAPQPPIRRASPERGSAPAGDLDALLEALAGAARPAILAGHGVMRAGAVPALMALAERLGAPVATSRSGIGSISTDHDLSVGMLGFYGTEAARDAIAGADLVLILGCALGEQTTFGWRPTLFAPGAALVQVDVDASQINRVYRVDHGIAADAGAVLDTLGDRVEAREPWFGRRGVRQEPHNDPDQGLSAATVMQALNRHAPDDALFAADIGNHRLWVCDQLDVTRPEGVLQSCEFDAMGFSLPAAIGAAVAGAASKVVSISGDGGFVHTMGELSVAKQLDLPVVAVVFVDGALGILKHQAQEMYGEHHYVELPPIDFALAAEAMGVPARTVATDADLDTAVEWTMQETGPTLLSVIVDPDEIFPPLLTKIEQRRIDLLGESAS